MEREDIVEQLATGKMSRRQFNRNLMALGATMVMMPLGSRFTQAASSDHPTVFTWEGWEVPELHKAYVDKHGSSPNIAIFADEEEAFAKMRAGFKVDLTHPCSYKVPIWKDAGILQPMDPSRLSNWSDIIPALKTIPGTFEGDKQYFIPTDWGLTSVLYRADLAPEYVGNETWGMLWDPKYKGRLSMAEPGAAAHRERRRLGLGAAGRRRGDRRARGRRGGRRVRGRHAGRRADGRRRVAG